MHTGAGEGVTILQARPAPGAGKAAGAPPRPIELGIDAGLSVALDDDPWLTTFQLPAERLRALVTR